MATKFNPETNVDPGPQFDFKGAMVNNAGEIALKGIAQTGGLAVQATHDVIQDDMKARARSQVEGLTKDYSIIAAGHASTTPMGQPQPMALERGLKEMEKHKNRYLKGGETESDYLSNIDVITKGLRSRYGDQWADDIDAAVSNAVSNSANNYRKQLWLERDALKDDETKRKDKQEAAMNSLINANMDIFPFLPREMQENPGAFSYDQVRVAIGDIKRPLEADKQKRDKLALEVSEGTADSTDATLALRERVNNMMGLTIGTLQGQAGAAFLERTKGYYSDKHFTAAELEKTTNDLREMNTSVQSTLSTIMNDVAYSTVPPAEKAALISQAKDQLAVFENLFNNKDYGMLSMFANKMNWATNDTALAFMGTSAGAASGTLYYKAMDDLGWGQFFEQDRRLAAAQLGGPDAILGRDMIAISALLLGEKNMNQYVYAMKEANKNPNGVFHSLASAISSPLTTPEQKGQAAAVLFDPKNTFLLDRKMITANKARELFNILVSPETRNGMIAMKNTNPEAFDNYYRFATGQGFQAMFQFEINSVAPDAEASGLKWDPVKLELSSKKARTDYTLAGKGGAYDNKQYLSTTENFVTEMNKWVKKVRPILEANGQNVSEQLQIVMEVNRITPPSADPDAVKDNSSWMSAYRKAVEEAIKRENIQPSKISD